MEDWGTSIINHPLVKLLNSSNGDKWFEISIRYGFCNIVLISLDSSISKKLIKWI